MESNTKYIGLIKTSFCGTEMNSPRSLGGIVMYRRWQETSSRYGLISAQARCWLPFISLSLSTVPAPLIAGITANSQLIISLKFLLNFSLRCWRCHLGFEFALIGFNLKVFVSACISGCASKLTRHLVHITNVRYNLVKIPRRALV